MALPPLFQGVDFSGWRGWPSVSILGQNYYSIPNVPGYLYDPGSGGAGGTILTDGRPTQAILDSQKPKPVTAGQSIAAGAGQVAGTIAGTAGGALVYNHFANGTTAPVVQPVISQGAQQAASANAVTPLGNAAASPITSDTVQIPSSFSYDPSATSSLTPVGDVSTAGESGTTAATAEAPGVFGGYVVPGAQIAAGLYGGYQTANMIGNAPSGGKRNTQGAIGGAASGAALGAGLGTLAFPGVGTAAGALIGGAAGGAAGLAGSYFGSHKDKYQQKRDQGRQYLKQSGLADQKGEGTLADGSTFNFDAAKGDKGLDFQDPVTGKIVSAANMIAAAEGFVGQNLQAQASLYANAALSNANGDFNKATDNIKHFAEQRGLTAPAVNDYLAKQATDGNISDDELKVYQNEANTLLPTDNHTEVSPGVTMAPTAAVPVQAKAPVTVVNKPQFAVHVPQTLLRRH